MTRVRDIEATITLLPTSEGGRTGPAFTGYRPQFHYDDSEVCDAEHEYPDVDEVRPGDTTRAYLRFTSPLNHLGRIVVGMEFTLREGARVIGTGVVTKILDLARSAERARLDATSSRFRTSPDRRWAEISVTRDSVCAGDDADAPHEKTVSVPALRDPAELARRLAEGYLASVAGVGHSWTCVLNGVKIAEITVSDIRALVREISFSNDSRAHFVYRSARY